MLPAATLLKVVCKAKLIYDAHELESECQGMPRSLKLLARTTESKLWSKVDVFITVSKSIETWYFNKYGNKKSLIIFNSPQIISESFEVENQRAYLETILANLTAGVMSFDANHKIRFCRSITY